MEKMEWVSLGMEETRTDLAEDKKLWVVQLRRKKIGCSRRKKSFGFRIVFL